MAKTKNADAQGPVSFRLTGDLSAASKALSSGRALQLAEGDVFESDDQDEISELDEWEAVERVEAAK